MSQSFDTRQTELYLYSDMGFNKSSRFFQSLLLVGMLLCCFLAKAQRDTFALYEMGEVARVDGLWYGTSHTLLLYDDSTFVYSGHVAMQISTGKSVIASGTWTKKNDLFTFKDPSQQNGSIQFSGCSYDDEEKNLRLRFNFGHTLTCFDLPLVLIYSNGFSRVVEVKAEALALSEEEAKLKKNVPSFSAFLEVDLSSCDSLKMYGITVVPGEPTCNFFGFSCKAPFVLKLIQKGDHLEVVSPPGEQNYIFERVR